ncbi:MAG: phenylalanine--tRNA ligase subunit beta [Deltaproteobacteria bacterium]|nr:phenylalanine--tRNA ligase subunit beta [Deltaproteobacteria bacterium]
MPIVDMPVGLLLDRLAAAGANLSLDRVVELLPRLGCEIAEVALVRQYECGACGRLIDRTEAQGRPAACPSCGADLAARPDLVTDRGDSRVLRLDMLAVRPDLYDPGGMARFLAGWLGVRTGLAHWPLAAPRIRVRVDPSVADVRPHIACAVVRGVRLDHDLVKMIMNLQEDLHWALGRDRKLASIGVYDLDTVRAEEGIVYEAVEPDALRFTPLGFRAGDPDALYTPRQILTRHRTGQAYAHLLAAFDRYPILRDRAGTVLSMPPIINSESTRVTLDTRAFFVDVTGLSRRTVDRSLAVMVACCLEALPGATVEAVTIEDPSGERVTPDLAPVPMVLDVREAAETLGMPLDAATLADLLGRMGHAVDPGPRPGTLQVRVPATRNDVMHPVDLMEDAAVAFGYENIATSLVPTFLVGRARPVEERAAVARRVLAGLGFHQVMTLVLTSEEAAFRRWGLPDDDRRVRIANPISTEQTICRVSLLPGLMETLGQNRQHDLPQSIFEVGDACFLDAEAETGAREARLVGVALVGTHVGFADARAVLDAFVHEMGARVSVAPLDHPGLLPGRAAAVLDTGGRQVGILGEVHPRVLETYGLHHPVAVVEVGLEALGA